MMAVASSHGNVELPREVLQRIFSLSDKAKDSAEPLLTLKDRVRCQAVCRAWREYLSPARWPLQQRLSICLGGATGAASVPYPAEWILRTQPPACSMAVVLAHAAPFHLLTPLGSYLSQAHCQLRELDISLHPVFLCSLWPAVCTLPAIRALSFSCLDNGAGRANLNRVMLAGLPPSLASLHLGNWRWVELRCPEPLLPALTRLVVSGTSGHVAFSADVALPSLRELVTTGLDEVNLAGPNLSLPQLTLLVASVGSRMEWMEGAGEVALRADFGRMPQLASLGIEWVALDERSVSSFASLAHLTRLVLDPSGDHTGDAALALRLLQLTPPSLRSLHLSCDNIPNVPSFAAAVRRLTGLESLTGTWVEQFLPVLAPLTRLQELEMSCVSCLGGVEVTPNTPASAILGQLTSFICFGNQIPRYLPFLSQLQELGVLSSNASSLTVEMMGLLAAVPGLRKLSLLDLPYFTMTRDEMEEQAGNIEVLRGALPACEVVVSNAFTY